MRWQNPRARVTVPADEVQGLLLLLRRPGPLQSSCVLTDKRPPLSNTDATYNSVAGSVQSLWQ
jgi:hypothetical protein